jgi:hypothetical protein
MLDQANLPWFSKLNQELRDDLDGAQFNARIDAQLLQLNELAAEIVVTAHRDYPDLNADELIALIHPSSYAQAQTRGMHFLFGAAA